MIDAAIAERWGAFFAAEVGAAAALTGLIIVAISINVSRIISHPGLPPRAAETLVAPAGVLIAATYALVPEQPAVVLGWEWIATGAVMWLLPVVFQIRALRSSQPHRASLMARAALAQFSSVPFVIAGAMVLAGSPTAFYWIVPGIVAALIGAILNTWVLLIEILR